MSRHAGKGLPAVRIGIDLGGSKIEGLALASDGRDLARERLAAPRGDYRATIEAIAGIVERLSSAAGTGAASGASVTVGVGMPGSIAPSSGLVQNANSTWLNGRPFAADLGQRLELPLRLANDANCFALSEAVDGAGAGARTVFGVILGTGVGGGIVRDRALLDGPRGIGGEWGHNPLPRPRDEEVPGPLCWCGRHGCLEAWLSGPALAADHQRATGDVIDAAQIAERAAAGDGVAQASLARHAERLARGIAHVVNIIDPDVVVLGGGLSRLAHLYARLPDLVAPHVFADGAGSRVDVRPPRWGDASGVRGAAWLWGGPGGA
ncbi:MAG: ROK family protein [Hyphomicrobiaceae bacterium]|nr:ROK family protein [Hyphomicrobiaceae bacterium]